MSSPGVHCLCHTCKASEGANVPAVSPSASSIARSSELSISAGLAAKVRRVAGATAYDERKSELAGMLKTIDSSEPEDEDDRDDAEAAASAALVAASTLQMLDSLSSIGRRLRFMRYLMPPRLSGSTSLEGLTEDGTIDVGQDLSDDVERRVAQAEERLATYRRIVAEMGRLLGEASQTAELLRSDTLVESGLQGHARPRLGVRDRESQVSTPSSTSESSSAWTADRSRHGAISTSDSSPLSPDMLGARGAHRGVGRAATSGAAPNGMPPALRRLSNALGTADRHVFQGAAQMCLESHNTPSQASMPSRPTLLEGILSEGRSVDSDAQCPNTSPIPARGRLGTLRLAAGALHLSRQDQQSAVERYAAERRSAAAARRQAAVAASAAASMSAPPSSFASREAAEGASVVRPEPWHNVASQQQGQRTSQEARSFRPARPASLFRGAS
eukprot:CAMPEP_0178406358 /NCGR_PEP_ID=MMETSP0689_2-20121128/18871_1 /TAXON_ID=160604 /ORGANISM="Amphidinium massartii, Strain CS-259" /LENGTH=444 /DNA_ID=CAMNT_0020027397 /DNA_START=152 /DNA_END=1487 /DNA_ORIENTATION=+